MSPTKYFLESHEIRERKIKWLFPLLFLTIANAINGNSNNNIAYVNNSSCLLTPPKSLICRDQC